MSRLFGKHILSAQQFTRSDLETIFRLARELRVMLPATRTELLRGKHATLLFYEPSSRTAGSFDAAMQRLGGTTTLIVGMQYSSVAKGESLRDTVRTFECFSDLLVLRHKEQGSAEAAARVMRKPLINAGDGVGEHPTQALLDLFTIDEELGDLAGLTITLLGDLKNGRTVHALAHLLSLHDVSLHLVSPPELRMPQPFIDGLIRRGVTVTEDARLEDVLPETDVLYVTRAQTERFANAAEAEAVKNGWYVVSSELLACAKKRMIVMHPFPRNEEIAADVDDDPRAVYFRQIENGMYVRMALLCLVLGAR